MIETGKPRYKQPLRLTMAKPELWIEEGDSALVYEVQTPGRLVRVEYWQ